MSCMTILFLNLQITRHWAIHKVGCQPGDCIWSLQFPSGVSVGTYGLTYSPPPQRVPNERMIERMFSCQSVRKAPLQL